MVVMNMTTATTNLAVPATNLSGTILVDHLVARQQNDDHSNSDPNCWPVDATSILFQLAYILLLIAYLAPGGKYCLLFIHSILALAHLLITVWVWKVCFTIPSLLGWSITFLCVNVIRVAIQLYTTRQIKFAKELEDVYEELFNTFGVPRYKFKKLVSIGKLVTLHSGETYAVEKVTPTNRLSLLISGKINVTSRNHFLHSIKPKEFLDSPEWESGVGYAKRSNDIVEQQQRSQQQKRPFHFGGHHGHHDKHQPQQEQQDQPEFEPLTMRMDSLVNPITNMAMATTTNTNARETNREPAENRFNVTLMAATQCRILCWNRTPLEYYMAKDRQIFKVLSLIIGRDITNKLYAMNEQIAAEKGSMLDIRLPVLISSWTKHLDFRKNADHGPRLSIGNRINRPSLSSTATNTNNNNNFAIINMNDEQQNYVRQPTTTATTTNSGTHDH